MAWQPDYCTAIELKAYLRIGDAADDSELGFAITAASRAIDQECNRQFGVSTAVARYYTWDESYLDFAPVLEIDDIQSVTSLAVVADSGDDGTYEHTLVNGTDFEFYPWNATANGRPWTHIVLKRNSLVLGSFPTNSRAIKITGLWGWTAVPTVVKQAALVQASRFFARRNSPFGIAGSPDLGNELRLLSKVDPDVAVMLNTVKRRWGAVN